MTLCAKCKKNPAVFFITKMENGKTTSEGLCLSCAKELGIAPINQMIDNFGVSDEELENINNQMSEFMESMEGMPGMDGDLSEMLGQISGGEDDEGGAATAPLDAFLSREFLSFLIVGGINTVSNVIFSTIYSLFIPNTTLAFFPGYITSNVVSYLLNSKLTFKERLGFVKFIKFFISYIPNFIIQTIIVWLFDNFIHGPSVIAYAIAAIIGVPVTFVFMKIFTFKKND